MAFLDRIKITWKLPILFLILSMGAALATAYLLYNDARKIVLKEASARIEAVATSRADQFKAFLARARKDLHGKSSDRFILDTFEKLDAGWKALAEGTADTPSEAARRLYIEANPNGIGSRDRLGNAGDGSSYSETHSVLHNSLRSFNESIEYYDIFMINAKGDVVYSVTKEDDYGTNLVSGPYADSGLGEVFRAAMGGGVDEIHFADIAPYAPSAGAPASFMAIPMIGANGDRIGVFALQMPNDQIDALMLNEFGLGQTGQAYILGEDRTLRSNARFEGENAVMQVAKDLPGSKRALAGEHVSEIDSSGDGGAIVRAYVPVALSGTNFAVIVEQDLAELMLPLEEMRQSVLIRLGIIAAVLGAISIAFARTISQPLQRVARAMSAVASRDFSQQIPTCKRSDEVGEIGCSLEKLRSELLKAEEKMQIEMLKGAAFENSTAPLTVIGLDHRIRFANAAARNFFMERANELKARFPDMDPQQIVGYSVLSGHGNGDRVRKLLEDPKRLPHIVDAPLGELKLEFQVSAVLDAEGRHVANVQEYRDVTELRVSSAILDAIRSNQGAAEFSLDGRILRANENFVGAFGYSGTELNGRHYGLLCDEETRTGPDFEMLWTKLRGGEPTFGTFRRMRKDGSTIFIQASYNPVFDQSGSVTRIVEFCVDVTEQELARQKARKRQEALESEQAKVVKTLSVSLRALSEGNLIESIDTEFAEEYEQLRIDYNQALENLRTTLSKVIENASQIFVSAEEVSKSADDLAHRTEHQAGTLEETAAALEELTVSVQSSATGAERANQDVNVARKNAAAGGEVVREAVGAMGEIENSSQKISQIIGVIDDIAFQTNLLALNAGVEAARAGDAGKGFAVVASEVRGLAQRSSEAAKEIKDLINTSSAQVGRGVTLVGKAEAALTEIVDSISNISKLVSNIAVSAQEQSSGISEINSSVNQLDQVTQKNAAMVEETTAAGHLLRQQAEQLSNEVSRFQTDRGNPARSVAGAQAKTNRFTARTPTKRAGSSNPAPRSNAALAEEDWRDF